MDQIFIWQGMQDSNLRMHESKSCALPTWLIPNISGERTGIRTPDTRLRRALLYPAELCTHIILFGAANEIRTRDFNLGKVALYH